MVDSLQDDDAAKSGHKKFDLRGYAVTLACLTDIPSRFHCFQRTLR